MVCGYDAANEIRQIFLEIDKVFIVYRGYARFEDFIRDELSDFDRYIACALEDGDDGS